MYLQVNGNNVDLVTNAKHLGNVVDDKLSDLKNINAKKGNLIESVNGFVTTSEAMCLLNVIFDYNFSVLLQQPLQLNSMGITWKKF